MSFAGNAVWTRLLAENGCSKIFPGLVRMAILIYEWEGFWGF